MRFLLVEDNHDLGQSVQTRLSLDGHAVDWAISLADAEDHLAAATYDLILLDIMLPDGDGRDFLASHRRAKRDTPVIVMTARSAVADRVALLDTGADDYVTKPFDFDISAAVVAVWTATSAPLHFAAQKCSQGFSTSQALKYLRRCLA